MTTPDRAFAADDATTERAADFFERRRFGAWSDADQVELDAWLAQSTRHRVAYLRLEGAAAYTEHLAAVHTFKIDPPPGNAAPRGEGKIDYRRFFLPLLAAASVALIAALGIPLVNSWLAPPDRTYATDIGGRTVLKFTDGTVVDLNTDTAVRFRMTNEQRTVWLEKGEAWFHVAHNAANPFTVVAGKHRVTDLGTEFLVRRGADGMEIVLMNGRAALNADGAPAVMLAPGDDAVATRVSMTVTRKTPQELADDLAWRRGVLVFRSARLADAVREVNRYNTTKLVIADPSIADLRFSGEFTTDNFEDFLRLAQSMMKLRADRHGQDILLSRDAPETRKRAAITKREP